MRGYKGGPGGGDEQRLLRQRLGDAVPVEADPDRADAAGRVMAARPEVSVFLLDDGFQHRRVRRCFDLVLIDATDPFGGGAVLPRGLLRERPAGLARASAILLTRCELRPDTTAVEQQIRRQTAAPLFRSTFELAIATPGGDAADARGRKLFLASGIGNPAALAEQVAHLGGIVTDRRAFPDHHAYSTADANDIAGAAQRAGATPLVTGKDWVKLRDFWPDGATVLIAEPTLVPERADDLLSRIECAIGSSRTGYCRSSESEGRQ